MEAGAGITGKDNRSILRQGDGGVAPQDGGGSHLAVSVIHPEAGILRHLHGHGLAGGIADLNDARDFVALGADRLGTSRIVKAVKAMEQE